MATVLSPASATAGTISAPDPSRDQAMHPGHRYAHLYPTSDVPTMPEKPAHDLAGATARDSIHAHLGPQGGPLPVYRLVGDVYVYPFPPPHPRRPERAAPDLMLILRVIDWPEDTSYLAWLYGPPDLVLEVASQTTASRDLGVKKDFYETAGVPEYWLCDPLGWLGPETPRMQGWHLRQGTYHPIQSQEGQVHGKMWELYPSAVLGTVWGLDNGRLRLRVPGTETWYPFRDEVQAQLEQANARAEQEAARAEQEAQARAKLEAELIALRAQLGTDPNHDP